MVILVVATFLLMFCSRASKLLRSGMLSFVNLLATPREQKRNVNKVDATNTALPG